MRGEWGAELFQMVPATRSLATSQRLGSEVTRFKPGDLAAVGVIVEICLHCANCKARLEVHCSDSGARGTYNAVLRSGERTMGGYADTIVTPEHFGHTLQAGVDLAATAKHAGSFDFILNCVSAPHDMDQLLGMLKLGATLRLVGLPDQPLRVTPFSLLTNRRSLAGSAIGGMKETQEMLDFCAEKGITAEIELTTYDKVNEAYERVVKNDVKYV